MVILVALLFSALLLGIHLTLPRGYVKGWSLYVWAADEIEDKRAVRVPLIPGVMVSASDVAAFRRRLFFRDRLRG